MMAHTCPCPFSCKVRHEHLECSSVALGRTSPGHLPSSSKMSPSPCRANSGASMPIFCMRTRVAHGQCASTVLNSRSARSMLHSVSETRHEFVWRMLFSQSQASAWQLRSRWPLSILGATAMRSRPPRHALLRHDPVASHHARRKRTPSSLHFAGAPAHGLS